MLAFANVKTSCSRDVLSSIHQAALVTGQAHAIVVAFREMIAGLGGATVCPMFRGHRTE
jgi:hypothetical protein